MPSIPLLTTDGDAHACGRAHGQRFAREIADNVATYLRRFAASGLDRAEAFVEAETWRKAIATQSPGYAEEMRGIAEASGQSEQAIALLNARYELAFTLFGREATAPLVKTRELLDIGPDGCTTFGLEPTVTDDRHTWLGQNWDWLAGVHGRTFVLQVRRKGSRASSASPKPASPAARWASTSAGSGWSRTDSPRATMAAIPTASRFTSVAAKCWTPKHSNRHCSP